MVSVLHWGMEWRSSFGGRCDVVLDMMGLVPVGMFFRLFFFLLRYSLHAVNSSFLVCSSAQLDRYL
jgi:hypothetical protein